MVGDIKECILVSRSRGSILDFQRIPELPSSSKAIKIREKNHIYLHQVQATCSASLISSQWATNYIR